MGIPLVMGASKTNHMNNVKIVVCCAQTPQYKKETKEVIPFVEAWLSDQDERFRRKVVKLFEGAQVDKRYSIMAPQDVFTVTSFEEKNKIYETAAKDLGEKVLRKALKEASWEAESLDFIITVSCTGIMIPSLDAYLINQVGLKQSITRLPVTEMGCAAGISGIIYAYHFLKSNPGKRAAVISFEAPTATLQLNDFSMANMVSAAIFGDGAACVLLSSDKQDNGPKIIGEGMYHFFNNTHMMGFDLTNNGLKMVLDVEVPSTIANHFPKIIHPFLAEYNTLVEDITHFIFHPGGKKIIQTVEELFGSMGKEIDDTKEVLRLYGNMSSATVLYVLEKKLAIQNPKGTKGLMLSFGPGFSAQRVLLEW